MADILTERAALEVSAINILPIESFRAIPKEQCAQVVEVFLIRKHGGLEQDYRPTIIE